MNGKRYGMISVVSFAEIRNHKAYWNIICDCGISKTVRGEDLRSGKYKSCGCNKSHWKSPMQLSGASSPYWQGIGKISKDKFCSIRLSAKKRNLDFRLTIEEISQLFDIQNGKCALSGLVLTTNSRPKRSDGTYSLDRIDSSKGYIPGNVQWVHKELNSMKMAMSQERFIKMCIAVANHQRVTI